MLTGNWYWEDKMIFNAVLFNILWLGLVVIGNAFIPLAILGLCIHFSLSKSFIFEASVVACVAVIGLITDILLTMAGVFEFNHTPYWLGFLWLAFASTINHSLRWVSSIPYAAHFSGFIFAPLSYLAAERFGAVDFGYSILTTYFLLGVVWLLLFNIFVQIKKNWVPNYAQP